MRKYVIDNLLINPDGNEVVAQGRIIKLEPKAMSLLTLLALHAGETISKEEIFKEVWAGLIVSEDSITRCISQLRKVFNDDPQNPRVIETIARKGYRVKVPVIFVENENEKPVPALNKRKISPWLAGVVAAFVAFAFVYGNGAVTMAHGIGITVAAFSLVFVAFYYLNSRM